MDMGSGRRGKGRKKLAKNRVGERQEEEDYKKNMRKRKSRTYYSEWNE